MTNTPAKNLPIRTSVGICALFCLLALLLTACISDSAPTSGPDDAHSAPIVESDSDIQPTHTQKPAASAGSESAGSTTTHSRQLAASTRVPGTTEPTGTATPEGRADFAPSPIPTEDPSPTTTGLPQTEEPTDIPPQEQSPTLGPCPTGTTESEWLSSAFWNRVNTWQVRTEIYCGANASAMASDFSTPLHLAAQSSPDPAVVQALLNAGAFVGEKARDDLKPLHVAAQSNSPAVIKLLLDAGAYVDSVTKDGITPLHYAAALNWDPQVLQVLLDAGAELGRRSGRGLTALHFAAANNENPAVTQALLDAGADANLPDSFSGWTPLHFARRENNQAAIQVLCREIATTTSVPNPNVRGNNVWDYDFWVNATLDDLDFVLRCGVDVNAKIEGSDGPLHIASWVDNSELVRALIAAGANIELRRRSGSTPLHSASGNGRSFETVEALLQAGANPGVVDNKQWTPLHYSAQWATDPEVIRALLDAGADIEAKDNDGNTPLHMAAKGEGDYWNLLVIETLLDAGSDINSSNLSGVTPLNEARRANNKEAVRLMVNR